jgi:hypothetical protein
MSENAERLLTRGLVIDEPWISLILSGKKTCARNEAFHRIPLEGQPAAILARRVRPWVLAAARSLPTPIPYKHGSGPVIWVKLDAAVIAAIHAN